MSEPKHSAEADRYLERDRLALLQEIEDFKEGLTSQDWDKSATPEQLEKGRAIYRRLIPSGGLLRAPRHYEVAIELLIQFYASLRPELKKLYSSMSSQHLEEFIAFEIFCRDFVRVFGISVAGVDGLLRLSQGLAKYSALVGYWTAVSPQEPPVHSASAFGRVPWLFSFAGGDGVGAETIVDKLAYLRDAHWITNYYASKRAIEMIAEHGTSPDIRERLNHVASRIRAPHREDLHALSSTFETALKRSGIKPSQQEALLSLFEHWFRRALMGGFETGRVVTKDGAPAP